MDYTNLENCKKWLKENLNDERYRHSLGTAEAASMLAERFGLDKDKAYFCGLIHDCAKCIPSEELKSMICTCKDLCEGELLNPKTYHAPAVAIMARKEVCVEDEEGLSAIRWHTLGS
jgi:predicted HD superfamily hydrolase involved in NAD metabolism